MGGGEPVARRFAFAGVVVLDAGYDLIEVVALGAGTKPVDAHHDGLPTHSTERLSGGASGSASAGTSAVVFPVVFLTAGKSASESPNRGATPLGVVDAYL